MNLKIASVYLLFGLVIVGVLTTSHGGASLVHQLVEVLFILYEHNVKKVLEIKL